MTGESDPNSSDEKIDYPIALDVVLFEGRRYQVAEIAQTGRPDDDIYVINDIEDPDKESFRVRGATFNRLPVTEDPGEGAVYRREEGVRLTGELIGGEIEDS